MSGFFASTSPEVSASERAHMDLIRALAGECAVLLENDGTLPLRQPGRIALYGNGARGTVKGGTGSGDVNARFVVNIEQGLLDAGFTVTTGEWLDAQDEAAAAQKAAYLARMEARARREGKELMVVMMDEHFRPTALAPLTQTQIDASGTDTAVYVLSRNSGEGADRSDVAGDYRLLPAEREMLAQLGANYGKVIVLLNVGGVIDAAAIRHIPGISAVLLLGQLGNQTGTVAADLLLGRSIPSGRLADTWAMRYEDYPSSAGFSHNNGDVHDEYYTDGIYVGYRYFDTFNVTPLYPFGYGRSYTDFSLEILSVAADEKRVAAAVRVTNAGTAFPGKETVQIYASAPEQALEQPYQVLAAFAKTKSLAPGESQELTITFPLTNLESYDPARAAYLLEAGTYYIRIGSHSRNTKVAAALRLDRTAVTRQVKNICPPDREFAEISAAGVRPYTYPGEEAEKAAAPVLCLMAERIPCETVSYAEVPAPPDPAAAPAPPVGKGGTAPCVSAAAPADPAGKGGTAPCVSAAAPVSSAGKGGPAPFAPAVGPASPAGKGGSDPFAPAGTDHVITMEDVRAGAYTMEQLVSQLTVEEMADLCVGTARDDAENPVGASAVTVPGAAGDTSTRLAYRGVRGMLNADGPAGLRLTPHFRTDAQGRVLPGGEIFGDYYNPLPEKRGGEVDYYQYCTAVPIASMLASSWDLSLLEAVGGMVGAELEQFGVRVWLAPGMNIHRNPLCGRNFEYFSEDPLLSGLCAAADVRGVQRHPGIGTSIKHFFANNQEDNRMFLNAHIGERALREIYLRNFAVAIRAAQPMTIMTSYNLVNGIHAANSYDAITCFAREENGFAGYVMTDWSTSNDRLARAFSKPDPRYPSASSPLCIYAGNDIQMPGCSENVRDILEAVSAGTLPLGLLQRCCARLLGTCLACAAYDGARPYAEGLELEEFVTVQSGDSREAGMAAKPDR